MKKKLTQVAAGLALTLPLAGFALASGGGQLLGNVAAQGYGEQKVQMCHNGHTITIASPAVPAHEKQGDTLGPCP